VVFEEQGAKPDTSNARCAARKAEGVQLGWLARAVGVSLPVQNKTRKARRESERHLVNHIPALPAKMLSSQSNSLINVAANAAPHHDALVNKPTPSTKKRRFAICLKHSP
jgi:hypothetical protein